VGIYWHYLMVSSPFCILHSLAKIIAEVQVKKHFTAEEHAMRRAEMARRRKNLSEKRNEEEKVFHPIQCHLKVPDTPVDGNH
jgi:hypothetical protein